MPLTGSQVTKKWLATHFVSQWLIALTRCALKASSTKSVLSSHKGPISIFTFDNRPPPFSWFPSFYHCLIERFAKLIAKMSSINGPSSTTPLLGEQSSRIRSTDEQTVGVAASHDTVDIKNDGSMAKGSLEQWNDPSINMWRVSTTFFSFMVVGAIDGAYGV